MLAGCEPRALHVTDRESGDGETGLLSFTTGGASDPAFIRSILSRGTDNSSHLFRCKNTLTFPP